MTDAAVVRRVLAGDVEAFALLVDRYYDRYARYATHMLGSREDAEEVLQDAFLRAYRSLARYEERERFAAWLFRIVMNQCRTVVARRRKRELSLPDWALLAPAAGAAVQPAEQCLLREELAHALAQLQPEQREAVLLKYTEEFTYEEMATITGTRVSALKMRVKRACDRLRELLMEINYV
ncbi:MAG TPA: RNA polymerase sigma factor [Gemmatimonadaceae bacterium]|nr:RNA polymerase sigma factor [Gemmatimonadaceae bacterium]